MYVCDYGYSSDIYQEELNKILEGDADMATTKYGFTKMTVNEFKSWIKQQGNYKYTIPGSLTTVISTKLMGHMKTN